MGVTLQALAARRGGDLFVPLIFRLALRLEQVSWHEALEDAPLVAHALGSAQRLFRTDACVNWFDTGLEAQAAGAPPIAHVLAVTRQLCETAGKDACVLGTVTGPATLLARLGAPAAERQHLDHAASLAVELARAYCEAGVGGLALLEDAVPQSPLLAGAFDVLFNLASYYGVPIVVVSRARLPQAVAEAYAALGAGYVVAPETTDRRVAAVAPEAFSKVEPPLPQGAAGRLVATTWEMPADTAPERLADFGARLKR